MTALCDDLTVQLAVAQPSDWNLRRYDGHEVLEGAAPGGDRRLNQLFEDRCDQLRRTRQSHRLAVDTVEGSFTFDELDELANRTARYLAGRGLRAGDRIGLLVDRSIWAYASMLAVMKLGAAYVPLDKQFPLDRIEFMVDDARITSILTVAEFADLVLPIGIQVIALDEVRPTIELQRTGRYRARRGWSAEDLCYIIYTSGSTGRPKGVPITHANVANFVLVAGDIYGLTPDDRVYQGLTLAFDFAVEEIWVPLVSGAALVPAPSGVTLIGPDLSDFLRSQGITALCCVPTLLATVEPDLPQLTFLLVSGEACPDELANRWHAEGRRFLNVYGPTEATVSATWTELAPEGRVTIGGPLPTYSIVILDVDEPRSMARGEIGEIGIAGPGLAPGYLNRDDKTAAAFVEDFIGITNNPSGRIYRTGDLGRINEANEVEYLGRIDTQVKIRGYRIELDEISSALMEAPGVAQAVVIDHTTPAGVTELAAYVTRRPGSGPLDPDELTALLRDRLPPYMIPSSYLELDELPMLPSHKVDRSRLPAPGVRRAAGPSVAATAPADELEAHLAAVVGRVLGIEHVATDANWFDGLGASSLLLVHVCNELRTEPRFARVSVRDLYQHQTVAELARLLRSDLGTDDEAISAPVRPASHRATRRQHLLCGALQTAWILLGLAVTATLLGVSGDWVLMAPGWRSALARSVVAGPGSFVAASALSILAKWVLVGRWQPQRIPVWSFGYFRYWAARNAIRANPLRVFTGSPIYNVYLRLLGARVGRGVSIWSTVVPVCTDLVTIGDNAVIRADASFNGCRIIDGFVETGPVTIGAHSYVGEATVLDLDTELDAFATIGHASSLQRGQRVPAMQTWHGSPAQPASTDYRFVPTAGGRNSGRRAAYSAWRIATLLLGLTVGGLVAWWGTRLTIWLTATTFIHLPGSPAVEEGLGLIIVGSIVFAALLVLGVLPLVLVPRLLSPLVVPGRVYPLYGVRYAVARTIARFGNSRFYNELFGDSSLILGFLGLIGYQLPRRVQTGSNFGMAQRHGNPLLCRVGSGTLVSDGLDMVNIDYSATSFVCEPVAIGDRSFLGNNIHIPARARLGDDCLLATKVLVPVDGQVRAGVGLLGSPPFEIPRSSPVELDDVHNHDPALRPERLSRKLRHNLGSMAGYVGFRYVLFVATIVPTLLVATRVHLVGTPQLVVAAISGLVVLGLTTFALGVGAEWLALGFRRLRPRHCSIYDDYYWCHERYWKWGSLAPLGLLNGTPWRPLALRMLGARIGRRVVDEGCAMTERSITVVGDDACLNERSTLQGHSLEDGIFKSDQVVVGHGCTIGVNAFVHYGTRLGDMAVLGADSFLLKGEVVPARASWHGNPARAVRPLPAWPAPNPSARRDR